MTKNEYFPQRYLNELTLDGVMKLMKYRIIITRDEDGMFVAECPSLPGCVSQGKTRAETVENIKDAITGYVESLQKHGEPIPPGIDEEVVEVRA